jgi:hypothetical protein
LGHEDQFPARGTSGRWLMKDAARHLRIPPEMVCRWVVKHEAFREAYTVARVQRTEIWTEEIIEVADDATLHDRPARQSRIQPMRACTARS